MRIAPTHKAFDAYETTLADYRDRKVSNEGAVRFAFQTLLTTLAPAQWNVLGEQTLANGIRPDGVMKDGYNLTRGYWEAKDTADDLDEEIRKKTAKGYPLTNIIFEDTRRAVLYQNRQRAMDVPLTDHKRLADLLTQFFTYEEPDIVAFAKAVEEFRGIIPDLAEGLKKVIHQQREQTNYRFIAAFNDFAQTCRTSIDPNIADAALEEMLVQHLLTERLFRTVFNNPDFTTRNVIAAEIEKVINALASQSFSRADFLASLNRYYVVQKMKLVKDKSAVIVNPHLTLSGIPPETFRYRLGNRSALEWVLDQYQISTDARSGITSDPNRSDDPDYIVRLVGQVVAVGVATVAIVVGLPPLPEVSLMADRASDASAPCVV